METSVKPKRYYRKKKPSAPKIDRELRAASQALNAAEKKIEGKKTKKRDRSRPIKTVQATNVLSQKLIKIPATSKFSMMQKSNSTNEKLYAGTPVGENNLAYNFNDIVGFAQVLATRLCWEDPYLVTVLGSQVDAMFSPSTLTAYLCLAALQYFKKLDQLNFGAGFDPTQLEFFQDDWPIPYAFGFFLAHIGRSSSAPFTKNVITLNNDYTLDQSGIYPSGAASNLGSLQLPVGAGFQWLNASSIVAPALSAPTGNYGYLSNVQFTTDPTNFPYQTWLVGTNSFFNLDGDEVVARILRSTVVKCCTLSQIPMESPDFSGFAFPVGTTPNVNWWNAQSVAFLGLTGNKFLAPIFAVSRSFTSDGIFPPFFLDCMADVTIPAFSPSQNTGDFALVSNTVIEQYMQYFIWFSQNADKFYENAKAVRWDKFITVSGYHPPELCKVLPRYVDYYQYINNCWLIFERFVSSQRGGQFVMDYPTSDTVTAWVDYCTEAFRAKVHMFQLDMGHAAGCVDTYWGNFNNVVGLGILDAEMPIALKALLDQIGLVIGPGNVWYYPQLNENFGGAIFSGTTINGLVQFPYVAGGQVAGLISTPFYNGAPEEGNVFPWFPFTNFDQPINANFTALNTGPNQVTGAGTSGNSTSPSGGPGLLTFYQQGAIWNRGAPLAGTYLANGPVAGAFKSQMNNLYGLSPQLTDYVTGFFSLAPEGQKNTMGLANLTLWGGPGMYAMLVNVQAGGQILYDAMNCVPVDSLGNALPGTANAYLNQVSSHMTFSQSRIESAVVLTAQEVGLVLTLPVSAIYRTNASQFSVVSPSSFILAKYNVRNQFKALVNECVSAESALLTQYLDDEKQHGTKYTSGSYIARRKKNSKNHDDCLWKGLKTFAAHVGGVLMNKNMARIGKQSCKVVITAAGALGIPIPGGTATCVMVEKAIKSGQGVVHHYRDRAEVAKIDSIPSV